MKNFLFVFLLGLISCNQEKILEEFQLDINNSLQNGFYSSSEDLDNCLFVYDDTTKYTISKEPLLSLSQISSVEKIFNPIHEWHLSDTTYILNFSKKGSKELQTYTAANIGLQSFIIYNDQLLSNPFIHGEITGGQIQLSGDMFGNQNNTIISEFPIMASANWLSKKEFSELKLSDDFITSINYKINVLKNLDDVLETEDYLIFKVDKMFTKSSILDKYSNYNETYLVLLDWIPEYYPEISEQEGENVIYLPFFSGYFLIYTVDENRDVKFQEYIAAG